MKEIERIARLEIEVENIKNEFAKEVENIKNEFAKQVDKRRKTEVEVYKLKKRLKFFTWISRSWKNVIILLILLSLYFSLVDMAVSTETVHAWFFQDILPMVLHRIAD